MKAIAEPRLLKTRSGKKIEINIKKYSVEYLNLNIKLLLLRIIIIIRAIKMSEAFKKSNLSEFTVKKFFRKLGK